MSQDLSHRLDGVLADSVGSAGVPGAQAALLRDGDVLWAGACGLADRVTSRPVDVGTVFCLASIGKTLVAAVALRLVEQGRLDLDTPIASALDDEVPGSQAVTPRMLLAHTSGYPDLYDTPEVAALMPPDDDEPGSGAAYDPARPFTWEMLTPGIREPVEPGVRWEYSNAGYIVLTELLVRVLRGPDGLDDAWSALAAEASDLITDEELTMHRSRVPIDRLARGYAVKPDGSLVDPYAAYTGAGVPTDLFGLPFGDGLFAGTATGIAAFLDALFVRRTVLEPATVALMTTTTPQAAAVVDVHDPALATYGLGTFRTAAGGLSWQGHRGTYGGFNVVAMSQVENGHTLAVLTNAMAEQPQAMPIWQALVGELRQEAVTEEGAAD